MTSVAAGSILLVPLGTILRQRSTFVVAVFEPWISFWDTLVILFLLYHVFVQCTVCWHLVCIDLEL